MPRFMSASILTAISLESAGLTLHETPVRTDGVFTAPGPTEGASKLLALILVCAETDRQTDVL